MAAQHHEAEQPWHEAEPFQLAFETDPTPSPHPVVVDLPVPPPADATHLRTPHVRPRSRWKPLAAGLYAMALFVMGGLAVRGEPRAEAIPSEPNPHALRSTSAAAAAPMPLAEVSPSRAPARLRADAHADRSRYSSIPGGVLFMPKTFSSEDGAYDLYLHFHGNTRVVLESAEVAGINAAIAVINLGVNSAPYLDAYASPGSYELLLDSIQHALTARGLSTPHLRRVAWGSWSGGYGAISRIFELGRGLDTLDAVLVLDGIHCGFLEENPKALNVRIISPFIDMAKQAAQERLLFSITHSEIDPRTYAGSYMTANYLLDVVHGHRGAPGTAPEHLALHAAEGAVAKRLEKRMEPISEATVGSFHVRGYRGNTPEHHMAHLLQMGATVMPELAERWHSHDR